MCIEGAVGRGDRGGVRILGGRSAAVVAIDVVGVGSWRVSVAWGDCECVVVVVDADRKSVV